MGNRKTDKQVDRIYQYMKKKGSITPLDAMKDLGVMRLASRISELKEMGIPITRKIDKDKNMFGEDVHFARYFLKED